MMPMHESAHQRAVVLLSGGLDSALAACLVRRQGVEVIGLNLVLPFGSEKDDYPARVAHKLGVPLFRYEVDLGEYLEIVRRPYHGYGANMNPCIDCHTYMLTVAGKLMPQLEASFLVTGDVLGERPMSQHRRALEEEDRASGLSGLVLRPLSARLLPETIPEERGWVAREEMLDIRGRSRRIQLGLAKELGLYEMRFPISGCLLTHREFAIRLKHLLKCKDEVTKRDLFLLRIGRHFYAPGSIVIVGRNEKENHILAAFRTAGDYLFEVRDYTGPMTLLLGPKSEEAIELAASLTARYSDASAPWVRVKVYGEGAPRELSVNLPSATQVLSPE